MLITLQNVNGDQTLLLTDLQFSSNQQKGDYPFDQTLYPPETISLLQQVS